MRQRIEFFNLARIFYSLSLHSASQALIKEEKRNEKEDAHSVANSLRLTKNLDGNGQLYSERRKKNRQA